MPLKDYDRLKKLGEGGFGSVFLVREKSTRKLFVMKQVELSAETRAQALQEVKFLANIHHPNIIEYHEYFEEKHARAGGFRGRVVQASRLFIVMAYAAGGDLGGKIANQRRTGTPFRKQQVLNWFVQIVLALKHLHDRKVLHRDLKAQNIFLTVDNTVKLGDFGIARALDATSAQAHTVIGTPFYMAPEIFSDIPYSTPTDMWALGVLLYELVALKHPFQGNAMADLIRNIKSGRFARPPRSCDPALCTLLSSLLQVRPQARPTANEVLELPFIQHNIHNFLSTHVLAEEFSHTILHHQRVPLRLPRGKQKKGAAPAAAAPAAVRRRAPPQADGAFRQFRLDKKKELEEKKEEDEEEEPSAVEENKRANPVPDAMEQWRQNKLLAQQNKERVMMCEGRGGQPLEPSPQPEPPEPEPEPVVVKRKLGKEKQQEKRQEELARYEAVKFGERQELALRNRARAMVERYGYDFDECLENLRRKRQGLPPVHAPRHREAVPEPTPVAESERREAPNKAEAEKKKKEELARCREEYFAERQELALRNRARAMVERFGYDFDECLENLRRKRQGLPPVHAPRSQPDVEPRAQPKPSASDQRAASEAALAAARAEYWKDRQALVQRMKAREEAERARPAPWENVQAPLEEGRNHSTGKGTGKKVHAEELADARREYFLECQALREKVRARANGEDKDMPSSGEGASKPSAELQKSRELASKEEELAAARKAYWEEKQALARKMKERRRQEGAAAGVAVETSQADAVETLAVQEREVRVQTPRVEESEEDVLQEVAVAESEAAQDFVELMASMRGALKNDPVCVPENESDGEFEVHYYSGSAGKQRDESEAELKFRMQGQTIQVPNTTSTDSLAYQLESLRTHLAAQLGDERLVDAVRAARNCLQSERESEDVVLAAVKAVLPPDRQNYASLIRQMMQSEERLYS